MALMVLRREFLQGVAGLVAAAASPRVAWGAQPRPQDGHASGEFSSKHNYFIYAGGEPIRELVVTIEVTEDIVVPHGLSLQLNGYAQKGARCDWQQYVTGFHPEGSRPLTMGWSMENWGSKEFHDRLGLPHGSDLFNVHASDVGPVPTFPAPGNRLPAGYKIRWKMLYEPNDPGGLIAGAEFSFTDNHGRTQTSGPQRILSFKYSHIKKPITREALVPLTAVTMNLVGTSGGRYMFIEAGVGTITYEAAVPLTAEAHQPSTTSGQGVGTGEMSNIAYDDLDSAPSRKIVQGFRAARTPKLQPGGSFAVSRRFGADATDLFAVSVEGKLAVFSVEGGGRWKELPGVGPLDTALPGSGIAAVKSALGGDRTSVFLVAQTEELAEFIVDRNGAVSGPTTVGAKNITIKGAQLAVSRQLGADRTDVFLVDKDGALIVVWQDRKGAWKGPAKIGPPGLANRNAHVAVARHAGAERTDVFVVGKDGTLNVFHAERADAWKGPDKLTAGDFARAGASVAIVERGKRVDAYIIDRHAQLHALSAEGDGAWSAPQPIGPKGLAASSTSLAAHGSGERAHVFVVDKQGALNVIDIDRDGRASDPRPIGQAGTPGKAAIIAASPQFGGGKRLEVFAIGATGEPIMFSSEDGDAWQGPTALMAVK